MKIRGDKYPDTGGSRMSGDVHVRFCEHVGVRFPCVTRLVVLIDGHPRQRGLRSAVEQRLRRELAKLRLEVNADKTRRVDLTQGQCFAFLGFLFRRIRSRQGRWMPLRLPVGGELLIRRQWASEKARYNVISMSSY